MILIALALFAVNAAALLALPRRWAPVPLLICACYTTRVGAIDFGPFTFTILRLLVLVGLIRVIVRRERFEGGLNGLDWLIVLWGVWDVASVAFHAHPSSQVVLRLRQLFDAWGMYFLFRSFCRSWDDVSRLASAFAILLVPLAVLMLSEKMTGYNPFAILGASEFAEHARGNGGLPRQGPLPASDSGRDCWSGGLSTLHRHLAHPSAHGGAWGGVVHGDRVRIRIERTHPRDAGRDSWGSASGRSGAACTWRAGRQFSPTSVWKSS